MSKKKRVHIVGIAGRLSAPLAGALKDKDWQVTGSDQPAVYPPVTDYLAAHKISYTRGYSPKNITSNLDLVIVAGSAFHYDPRNPEVKKAKKANIKTISQSEAIARFVVKKKSLVVAGSHGKTTTAAMLVSIFEKASLNPSFMFGGITKDLKDPLKVTNSDWSIVEGDEYPTFGFNSKSKFWHYRPRDVILTACHWEHQDVYKTEASYLETFIKFLNLIPDRGTIFACSSGENIKKVLKETKKTAMLYDVDPGSQTDWWADDILLTPTGSEFLLKNKKGLNLPLALNVLGRHNIQNAVGAAGLSLELGISKKAVIGGLSSFIGLQRRLEIIGKYEGTTLIKDISQTKPRVIAALRAIREHFPEKKIIVIFYPHYSGFRYKSSLSEFSGMFDDTDKTVITRVMFKKEINKKNRVLGKDIVQVISQTQSNVAYLPIDDDVVNNILETVKPESVVILMSSGNYREIDKKIIKRLQKLKKEEK